MIHEQVERFLTQWPVGSIIRPDDMSEKVEKELVRQGYLEEIPDSGFGYPMKAYRRVQPNGQTEL